MADNKKTMNWVLGLGAIIVVALVIRTSVRRRKSTQPSIATNIDKIPTGAINDIIAEAKNSIETILKTEGSGQMSMTGWEQDTFYDSIKNPPTYVLGMDGESEWNTNPNRLHDNMDGESDWNTSPNKLNDNMDGESDWNTNPNRLFDNMDGVLPWNTEPNKLHSYMDGMSSWNFAGYAGNTIYGSGNQGKFFSNANGEKDKKGGLPDNRKFMIMSKLEADKIKAKAKHEDIIDDIKSGRFFDCNYLKTKHKDAIKGKPNNEQKQYKDRLDYAFNEIKDAGVQTAYISYCALMDLRPKENKLAKKIAKSYDKEAKIRLLAVINELLENDKRKLEIIAEALKTKKEIGDVIIESAVQLHNATIAPSTQQAVAK